jgi:hypothetical protein
LNDSSNIQKNIGSHLITAAWLESQMPGGSQRSSSPPLIDETAEKKRRMRQTPVTLRTNCLFCCQHPDISPTKMSLKS